MADQCLFPVCRIQLFIDMQTYDSKEDVLKTIFQIKPVLRCITTILSVVLTCFATHAVASDITKCPSVSALKAEGVSEVRKQWWMDHYTYYPHHISNYDTEVNWKLEMYYGPDMSGFKTEEEALEWSNQLLHQEVSGDPIPNFIVCKRYDKCIAECWYEAGYNTVLVKTTDYY